MANVFHGGTSRYSTRWSYTACSLRRRALYVCTYVHREYRGYGLQKTISRTPATVAGSTVGTRSTAAVYGRQMYRGGADGATTYDCSEIYSGGV